MRPTCPVCGYSLADEPPLTILRQPYVVTGVYASWVECLRCHFRTGREDWQKEYPTADDMLDWLEATDHVVCKHERKFYCSYRGPNPAEWGDGPKGDSLREAIALAMDDWDVEEG